MVGECSRKTTTDKRRRACHSKTDDADSGYGAWGKMGDRGLVQCAHLGVRQDTHCEWARGSGLDQLFSGGHKDLVGHSRAPHRGNPLQCLAMIRFRQGDTQVPCHRIPAVFRSVCSLLQFAPFLCVTLKVCHLLLLPSQFL